MVLLADGGCAAGSGEYATSARPSNQGRKGTSVVVSERFCEYRLDMRPTITPHAVTAALGLLLLTAVGAAARSQESPLTVTMTGQAMIRSDVRATDPAALARIRSMLAGDVVFTNLEGTVAEPGESVHQGRGFLAPPQALDALQAMGFNLLALSD